MQKTLVVCLAFFIDVASIYDKDIWPYQDVGTGYQTRCTRRYTPGVCPQNVAVVWTFVFQIQNCSERLGCPTATRTNRFNNYRHCMRRCRSLANLYSQVLAIGGRNETDNVLRTFAWARREGDDLGLDDLETSVQEPEYNDEFGDLPLVNPSGDREREVSNLEDVIPPDIDYVRSDHIPNPYDLFHDAFGTN